LQRRATIDRPTPGPPDKPVGQRELAKAERRRRIIAAARDLIRETGNAGLSMRALAQRAGVSLATPYNLLGSKRAIVLAVLQDVRDFQERFSTRQTADPLEKIFLAADMAVEFYVTDPRFYKTLWAAVFDTTDEVRAAILNPKREAFWQGLVHEAAEAGAIAPEINVDLLQHQLDFLFRSVMLDWVVDELPSQAMGPAVRLGFALLLKGAAAPEWRGPLQARVVEAQHMLEAATQLPS
jgi:AcrR family transcriptional regulator